VFRIGKRQALERFKKIIRLFFSLQKIIRLSANRKSPEPLPGDWRTNWKAWAGKLGIDSIGQDQKFPVIVRSADYCYSLLFKRKKKMRMNLNQRTVERPMSCSGLGVHSGKEVTLTIRPAPLNHGIKFVRADLPDHPGISAHFNAVVDTSLATVIGHNGYGFIVSTIEHIMAAFTGLSIDNAIVELDGYEIPIMDGSAGPFTSLIRSAGIAEQPGPRCFFVVKEPIELRENEKSVTLYPDSTFRITYTIEFPHPMIGKQSYSLEVSDGLFESEISRARTFGFLYEIEYLRQYGFARGGSLENVVVLDEKSILNTDGLRYPDEFVRHKILDCLGDFSLLGMPVLGHLVVNKSGHAFNHAFLKKFFTQKKSWDTLTVHDISCHHDTSCQADDFQPEAIAS